MSDVLRRLLAELAAGGPRGYRRGERDRRWRRGRAGL